MIFDVIPTEQLADILRLYGKTKLKLECLWIMERSLLGESYDHLAVEKGCSTRYMRRVRARTVRLLYEYVGQSVDYPFEEKFDYVYLSSPQVRPHWLKLIRRLMDIHEQRIFELERMEAQRSAPVYYVLPSHEKLCELLKLYSEMNTYCGNHHGGHPLIRRNLEMMSLVLKGVKSSHAAKDYGLSPSGFHVVWTHMFVVLHRHLNPPVKRVMYVREFKEKEQQAYWVPVFARLLELHTELMSEHKKVA
jgi:hypothetical protein